MPIILTDTASVKGAYTIETLFSVLSTILGSRQILAGGYDPLKTGIVDNSPYTILSAGQAADLFGFGSQLHRMAIYFFKSSGGGFPCIAIPLPAASGGAASVDTITFATNASSSGTYVFRLGSYLSEDTIVIGVSSGDTPDTIAALLNTAIAGKPNLPYTATVLAGVVTLTSTIIDITSADLVISVNQKTEENEAAPSGMTVAIANTTPGAGKSDLAGLWSYLADETTPWVTGIVHPYDDTLELDGGRDAIGNPNDQSGLYDTLDYRPGIIYSADRTGEEAGLIAAIALGEGRKNTDVANCRLAAPDYPELGYEIASYAAGFIGLNSVVRSSSGYTRLSLPLLYGPQDASKDWTTASYSGQKSYRNRNSAVQAGITPIIYKDGVAKFGDVTTFWHPDDNQNAPFKYVVNQRKIWNTQNITSIYLNGDDLLDRPIVSSVAEVRQSEKPIDEDVIKSGLALLAGIMANFGWIYDAEFTIRNTTVTASTENPDRFDIVMPIIVSGNLRISNAEIQVDRNLQAVSLSLVA